MSFFRQGQIARQFALSPRQKGSQVILAEAVQGENLRAGQHGGIDLETGVLGRGPHQQDCAILHQGQKTILLGFVKAVDFIHE